jgi:hypothetical protein
MPASETSRKVDYLHYAPRGRWLGCAPCRTSLGLHRLQPNRTPSSVSLPNIRTICAGASARGLGCRSPLWFSLRLCLHMNRFHSYACKEYTYLLIKTAIRLFHFFQNFCRDCSPAAVMDGQPLPFTVNAQHLKWYNNSSCNLLNDETLKYDIHALQHTVKFAFLPVSYATPRLCATCQPNFWKLCSVPVKKRR